MSEHEVIHHCWGFFVCDSQSTQFYLWHKLGNYWRTATKWMLGTEKSLIRATTFGHLSGLFCNTFYTNERVFKQKTQAGEVKRPRKIVRSVVDNYFVKWLEYNCSTNKLEYESKVNNLINLRLRDKFNVTDKFIYHHFSTRFQLIYYFHNFTLHLEKSWNINVHNTHKSHTLF